MKRLRCMLALALGALALPGGLLAQQQPSWEMEPLTDQGWAEFDFQSGLGTGTNGVLVRYGDAFLTADEVRVNQASGEVLAAGQVRVQNQEQIWAGDEILYNFKTRQIQASQFRTGRPPVFAAGEGLHGVLTNRTYVATNGMVTTDDVAEPAVKVRARQITIIPGKKVIARHATLYVGGVPVFYFPYYSRSLEPRSNRFRVVPGYRSSFGPFLLGSYDFVLSDALDSTLHADYRLKRGVGLGPDLNYNFGRWGRGEAKYYYLYDQDPNADDADGNFPHNRQRVDFSYLANPATNLSVRGRVRYQGDTNVVREFFRSEYGENPQPSTYMEVNKVWQNFSFDTYVQPRVNYFLETIERLPDVRLTGYRQQLGATPVYYESESSVGYYRHVFDKDNDSAPYAAARADSFHQLLLPETFFGWLNVTPRVGGRATYYTEETGRGATADELTRGVFNTGAEVSAKASRLWSGAQSDFLELDGLRHIVQPAINYAYTPRPNYHGTNEVPQFDYEMTSLRLLPIEFPDYNDIDSIDAQNVLRFGLRNKLQTKREGQVVNFLDWDVYTDWRLRTNPDQTCFSDLYSDLTLRPRSWLTLGSQTQYTMQRGSFRLSRTVAELHPHRNWSWAVGHIYIPDDYGPPPYSLGEGANQVTTTHFFRINENWGLRTSHWFDALDGKLRKQDYAIYRDLRSWTAALVFAVNDSDGRAQNISVSLNFWLKAFPKIGRASGESSQPDSAF